MPKMDDSCAMVVFDLEMVFPRTNDYSATRTPYHYARIWQLGCVCEGSEYTQSVNPRVSEHEISEESKAFLMRSNTYEKFKGIPQNDTLAGIWKQFCRWLVLVAGARKRIVLVAQQADDSDAITLSVEMARYSLEWPRGYKVEVADAYHAIRTSVQKHEIHPGSWGVASVYAKCAGSAPKEVHTALADARSLAFNLRVAFALELCHSVGCVHSETTLPTLVKSLDELTATFWAHALHVLRVSPTLLPANRRHIHASHRRANSVRASHYRKVPVN